MLTAQQRQDVERARQVATRAPAAKAVFTTGEQDRVSDKHFPSSGPRSSCCTDPDGATLAKIGPARHDLDPVFAALSRQLLLLQSMYPCKAARSGGERGSHQDAPFLSTGPVTRPADLPARGFG